ncbi:hypothetical protein ACIKT0_01655 [Hansschlegelia beijingensis]|uniref:hypothetical protein n=1 Tax=Hansschlegelia beijingensis TaxID=1133344 RepID=UPI00387EEE8F
MHFEWADGDNGRVLAFERDIGRVRLIVPDWYSQRRRASVEGGEETWGGDGTNPPGSFDQISWTYAAMAAAATAGQKLVILGVSPTWATNFYESLQSGFGGSLKRLCDAISALDVGLLLWVGDAHHSAVDDGSHGDLSSDLNLRIANIMASPLFNTPSSRGGDFSWLSTADTRVLNLSSQTCIFDVIDNGGTTSAGRRGSSAPRSTR